MYGHLIVDKEANDWKNETVFNKRCWTNWIPTYRRMKIDPSCTKLKSKWIKDLDVKLDTLNLLEEKVENMLECIGTGGNFLNRILMSQALR